MEVFINENSLHGQFATHDVLEKLRTFLRLVNKVNLLETTPRVLRSEKLFEAQAIDGVHLGSTLGIHKDLSDTLMNNLKNTVPWEFEKKHLDQSTYDHNQKNYVTRSLAEITERQLDDGDAELHLLNFIGSIFGTSTALNVVKDTISSTDIACSYDEESFTEWLIKIGLIDPKKKYDAENTRYAPMDYQTVLSDRTKFEPTVTRNQGRKVYSRIGTTELWVVDNHHYGGDAHIEIFRASDKTHLGISEIDKIELNVKYKVKKRTLN